MDELKNNPQIIELLETLEGNGMHKEKGEVSALVSYIGDMEHTLSAMLAEMQEMRKERNSSESFYRIKTKRCGTEFCTVIMPAARILFRLHFLNSVTKAASLIGDGTVSVLVLSGAVALSRGVLTNAAILMRV